MKGRGKNHRESWGLTDSSRLIKSGNFPIEVAQLLNNIPKPISITRTWCVILFDNFERFKLNSEYFKKVAAVTCLHLLSCFAKIIASSGLGAPFLLAIFLSKRTNRSISRPYPSSPCALWRRRRNLAAVRSHHHRAASQQVWQPCLRQ